VQSGHDQGATSAQIAYAVKSALVVMIAVLAHPHVQSADDDGYEFVSLISPLVV
jgi:hypothetical protein